MVRCRRTLAPGFAALCLVCCISSLILHQSVIAETYTNPRDAGELYRLQGEYRGVIEDWGGNWGAQVVATSKNTLRIQLLRGGLPGDGFRGNEPDRQFDATLDADSKSCKAVDDSVQLILESGSMEIKSITKDSVLGRLTKIVRESKTLGLKPPPNAIVLYGTGETGVTDFSGASSSDYGLGVGGTSRSLMRSHRLHIEFRTPFQPDDKGQQRGNSGVYLQGRYEVQILDSFGLRGENNECGGIYQIAKPLQNMCFPPLTWQTYDVDFVQAAYDASGKKIANAKIRVEHNGVLIHDNLELEKHTPGKQEETPEPGPLYLQDHGNPVVFRNVWFVPIEPKR